MAEHAGYVHVWKGRTPENIDRDAFASEFLSWESRYVGNVRAINAALLDS